MPVERELVRDFAGLRAVVFFAVPAALRVPLAADLRVPLAAALRVPAALRVLVVLRVPVLVRVPLVLRLAPPVPLLAALERPLLELPSSSVHFPESTRCAASATASAINVPKRLALDITLVAACDAESAASSPASRILRRAAGLALIAAAAAASPAPSISRLIATLAILSTVDFPEEDFEVLFLVLDFAIAETSL